MDTSVGEQSTEADIVDSRRLSLTNDQQSEYEKFLQEYCSNPKRMQSIETRLKLQHFSLEELVEAMVEIQRGLNILSDTIPGSEKRDSLTSTRDCPEELCESVWHTLCEMFQADKTRRKAQRLKEAARRRQAAAEGSSGGVGVEAALCSMLRRRSEATDTGSGSSTGGRHANGSIEDLLAYENSEDDPDEPNYMAPL